MPKEYIERGDILDAIAEGRGKRNDTQEGTAIEIWDEIKKIPAADVVEVVRCKDCKHFQPKFVLTNNGERRSYTEEEIKRGGIVAGNIGINCGSRCERFGYWEENKIPVWFSENDFCSYGERKEK